MQLTGIFTTLALLVSLVHAVPVSTDEFQSNKAAGLRLISLAEDAEPVWMTEDEKMELMVNDTGFMDLTEIYDIEPKVKASKLVEVQYAKPSYKAAVSSIIDTLSVSNMQSTLSSLTAFNNRYYRASTGLQASNYIRDTIQGYITQYNFKASVALYDHSWTQKSIIAKIPGTRSGPVTILGGHMDSINSRSPTSGRSPGADDDGTGSMNLIEAFRALAESGFAPTYPVEFHWYSGEEAGLLGSAAIATAYANQGVQVKGMLQLDMTGYTPPGQTEVIAMIPDNVSASLTRYLGELVDEYCSIPWVTSPACGYGCSDHASWTRQGYASSFPFETRYGSHNPYIHTDRDTTSVSGFSWTHSLEYAKLAVAFAYESANSA